MHSFIHKTWENTVSMNAERIWDQSHAFLSYISTREMENSLLKHKQLNRLNQFHIYHFSIMFCTYFAVCGFIEVCCLLGIRIDKELVIPTLLSMSYCFNSLLIFFLFFIGCVGVTTIARQHIKGIPLMLIHCLLCGQMFVHVGELHCFYCNQYWGCYSNKVM